MENTLARRENREPAFTNYRLPFNIFLMSLSVKLAFRYFRTRRRSLARFTTLAAITGIAAGVASLIVANALARGFADEMQDKILTNTAHIAVSMKDGGEILNWQEISGQLQTFDNVERVSPTTYTNSIIIGGEAVSYAILIARDRKPETENRIEIEVGEKLASKIGAKAGGEVELVTLQNQTEPRRSRVFVENILKTGIYDYDSTWIIISTGDFAALNRQDEFAPTILNLSVKDIYETSGTAETIKAALDRNFQVIDWREANEPLFAALSLERRVSLLIISLIIFIAALNITTTLALLVSERRFDIAVLRTCGAKSRILVSIFMIEGLLIGFIGIFFGVAGGLLACSAGNYFKLVSLSEQVYALSFIPFHTSLSNVLTIVLAAFIICLLSTIYPAYRAVRIRPLDNLRAG